MRTRTRKLAGVLAGAALVAGAAAPAAAQANVQVGTSAWQWGNPVPQGNTLRALAFGGAAGTGYAAGDGGTLLKTTDGGSSWSGLRSGTTEALTQVQVVSGSTVVAGGGCVARRSDDGGLTFTRIAFTPVESDCDQPLVDLSFVDPRTGYLLLADGSVFATADGGEQFSPRTALPGTAASDGSATPQTLSFTSPTRGVAGTSDGRLLLTTDGGTSWAQVAAAGRAVRDVLFVSDTTGFAVGAGGLVLRTLDAGATWAPLDLGIAARDYRSISCADASSCLLADDSGTGVVRLTITPATTPAPSAPVPTPVTPAQTGTTTTPAPTPNPTPPAATPERVSAVLVTVSTRAIYAAASASATRVAAVGADGASVVSDDGGSNYTAVGSRLPASYGALKAGNAAGSAYALGARGALAVTQDGGSTWVPRSVPTTATLQDVAFTTAQAGYALDAAGGLFRTSNGGVAWQTLDTGTTQDPLGVQASGQTVLLAGPRGIRRSVDGGESFTAVSSKAVRRSRLFGLDRTGSTTFAYGARAAARSTDGGRTWRKVKLPKLGKRDEVLRLDVADARTGMLLTRSRRALRTTDGGRTWKSMPGLGSADVNDLRMSSTREAFAAAQSFGDVERGGIVLHTVDGGASWEPQYVIGTGILYGGLAAPARSTAFLLGGTTSLLSTTTGGEAGGRSALTLRTSSRKLRKPRTITISGRLSPARGGERVTVSVQRPDGRQGRAVTVRAASNGSFTTSSRVTKGTNRFVAQWVGDLASRGDGSAVLEVRVGR